jgi:hypothetical protein
MPTTVYDASLITFRARAKALYAFANQNAAAVTAGTTVRREQPTLQSGEVITTRKQGGCFCTSDAAGLSMTAQGPGPCGCAR